MPWGSWSYPQEPAQPQPDQQPPVSPGLLKAIQRMLGVEAPNDAAGPKPMTMAEPPVIGNRPNASKVPSPDFNAAPPMGKVLGPPPGMTMAQPPGVVTQGQAQGVVGGALEPFGQAGRLMMGASHDVPADLAGILAAAAPMGPPGVGKATYSALGRAVSGAKQSAMHPEQWLGFLRNQPGVKAAEIEHVGLEPWLKAQQGPVSREAVGEFVGNAQPALREVRKGGADDANKAAAALDRQYENGTLSLEDYQRAVQNVDRSPTKFSSYQLPGGSNYGETLLTLPDKTASPELAAKNIYEMWGRKGGEPTWEELPLRDQTEFIRMAKEQGLKQGTQQEYKSSHWDEPNVLLHVRHNDRMVPGPNGEPVPALHLEEIQSDWHQAGRKRGYQGQVPTDAEVKKFFDLRDTANPADYRQEMMEHNAFKNNLVPDAPFKQTWPDLALKRMLHRAATETDAAGNPKYHALSWTPGEAQAARYDLSKQISEVNWSKTSHELQAKDHSGKTVVQQRASPEQMPDIIGKEAADKLINSPTKKSPNNELHFLSGLDLKVGGEGMKSFYDKMLVDKANALVKKFGARVEQSHTVTHEAAPEGYFQGIDALRKDETAPVHVLRITPALREAAAKGFPTFAIGGAAALGASQNRDEQ